MTIRGVRQPIPGGTVMGRLGTGIGAPDAIPIDQLMKGIPGTVTSLSLDAAFGSTQGAILYRDSAQWKLLAPGTSGQFLETQGASANPKWATGNAGNVVGPTSATSGNVVLFDGTTGKLIKDGGTLGTNAFTSTAYLPLSGGTLTGNLLFTDATYDIGASGATRPRNLFLSGGATIPGTLNLGGATVSGTPTWSSSQAITLSTAAQPNVTSTGALSNTADITLTGARFNQRQTDNTSALAYSAVLTRGSGAGVFGNIVTHGDAANGVASIGIGLNGGETISITGSGITLGSNSLTAGAITGSSTIKTADPGLGAGAWRLGQVESGIGLALNTTSYIQIMVDGVAVKLAQVL